MKNTIIIYLKRFLPHQVVERIRLWRKAARQNKRFEINKGQDLLRSVVVLNSKFSIYVNPFLNGGVDEVIYETGCWEPELSELLKRHLPTDGTFIDIGANIGYHSLFAVTVVGKEGMVMAFEPLPRLQDQFRRSIEVNSFRNILIEPVALSDTFGDATLSLVEENIGASSIKDVAKERAVGGSVSVQVTTLDSYLDKFDRVDVIKIDIEGAEYEALSGAEALLRKFKPVVILEFSPQIYEKDRLGKTLDFYRYIKDMGYSLQIIGAPDIDLENRIQARQFSELHANILCLPKVTARTD